MKKTILVIFYIIFCATSAFSDTKVNTIYEGRVDAKIQLIVYESLTCSHCADFHNNVYPDLKENFIYRIFSQSYFIVSYFKLLLLMCL